jgi:hypothetical protein
MLKRQVLAGGVSHRDEKRGSCSLSWVKAEDVSTAVADSKDDCLESSSVHGPVLSYRSHTVAIKDPTDSGSGQGRSILSE